MFSYAGCGSLILQNTHLGVDALFAGEQNSGVAGNQCICQALGLKAGQGDGGTLLLAGVERQ